MGNQEGCTSTCEEENKEQEALPRIMWFKSTRLFLNGEHESSVFKSKWITMNL